MTEDLSERTRRGYVCGAHESGADIGSWQRAFLTPSPCSLGGIAAKASLALLLAG